MLTRFKTSFFWRLALRNIDSTGIFADHANLANLFPYTPIRVGIFLFRNWRNEKFSPHVLFLGNRLARLAQDMKCLERSTFFYANLSGFEVSMRLSRLA
jgi:hypothetical protein